jgi:hypothetical protein
VIATAPPAAHSLQSKHFSGGFRRLPTVPWELPDEDVLTDDTGLVPLASTEVVVTVRVFVACVGGVDAVILRNDWSE